MSGCFRRYGSKRSRRRALALSFLGLWLLGIGFFVTSVWFWQVAGFSFATVFSQRFNLVRGPA